MSAIGAGVFFALLGMFLFGAQEQVGLIFVIGGFVTLFTGLQQQQEQRALKERQMSRLGPRNSPAALAFHRSEDQYRAEEILRTPALPAIPVPISMQDGEFACYRVQTALSEARALPRLAGGYMPWEGAPSAADEGELYITNRRIYFSGRKETRDIPLAELATVVARADHVEIWRRGRPQPVCFALAFPTEVQAYIERARTTGPSPLPPAPPVMPGSRVPDALPAGGPAPSPGLSIVECPECGAANGLSANFCQNCAAPIPQGSTPTLNYPGRRA